MRMDERLERAAAAAAGSRAAALGELPEWNLADLYPGIDAPELKADIERAAREAEAFEAQWKGTLAAEAGRGPDGRLGEAVRGFEALEELIGRIASFGGLVYAGDTSDPRRAKLYGDIQEKMTDASAHLLFFGLELNLIDDELIQAALDADPASATTGPGCWTSGRTSPTSSRTASSSCSTRSRSPAAAPGTACSTRR